MNRPLKNFLDVLLCIAIFAVVQIFIQLAVAGIYSFVKEVDFTTVSDGLTAGKYSDLIVVSSVLSSLVTLLVFTFGKFAVISRNVAYPEASWMDIVKYLSVPDTLFSQ